MIGMLSLLFYFFFSMIVHLLKKMSDVGLKKHKPTKYELKRLERKEAFS